MLYSVNRWTTRISIHTLLAESDCFSVLNRLKVTISIHALLAESDSKPNRCTTIPDFDFYPRSPCGERRKSNKLAERKLVFLSTLSLRRATRTGLTCGDGRNISIHALLAESDNTQKRHIQKRPKFLSTLSLRRATGRDSQNIKRRHDFYPRSPCGERPRTQSQSLFA